MKNIIYIFLLTTSISSFGQEDSINTSNSKEQKKSDSSQIVEEFPEFPGGEDSLIVFISENVVYPQKSVDSNHQGTVNIEFVVEEDGSVSNAKVVTSVDFACDQEALRVVRKMPKWKPGRLNGKPVKVLYSVPISFKL